VVALREVERQVDRFMDEGRARLARDPGLRTSPGNILDALLVAAEEEPAITDREIRSNLLTLLMAGEDTTAHSLAWALVLLGRDPRICKRLQEEADQVLGERPYATAYDDLGALRYTDAVIQETLRLKAVAPVMLVEPLDDVDVDGYRFAKGSRIVLLTRAAANRPDFFSAPDQMRPERWLDAAAAGCPAHAPEAMFPFGGGPRLCPGRNLALVEMKLVLAMIAKNFNMELLTPFDAIVENMAFTMMPDRFEIRITHRR
jgi:cytochrome P450